MKILLAFTLLATAAFSASASPLLLKTSKEITKDSSEIIATFDATKYSQIRIGVHIIRDNNGCRPEIPQSLTFPCSHVSIISTSPDEFYIELFEQPKVAKNYWFTTTIDSPPDTITIMGSGKGKYLIRIWGQ